MNLIYKVLKNRKLRHAVMVAALHRGIAAQLKGMRAGRGWTRREVARRSGLRVATVVRAERGLASVDTLSQLARAFNVALVLRFGTWSELVESLALPVPIPPPFDEEFAATDDVAARPAATRQEG